MHIEESPVHQIAKKNNLQTYYPSSIDYPVIKKINSLNPDIIIVVAYGIILPSQLLNIPKFGCINIHVSLLPRWRGAAPIEHAMLAGDVKTGISVIKISPKLDAGDILHQESLNISADMYSDELTVALTNLGKQTMLRVLPKIFENKTLSKKQDLNKVTYAKKFTSVDRKINFNKKILKIFIFLIIVSSLMLYFIPSKAPGIYLSLIDGQTVNVRSYQGKPLLVTFWSITCSLCLEEIPKLTELYSELNPYGFEIIAIAMSYDPPNRVVELSKKRKIPYSIALDINSCLLYTSDAADE